MPLECRKSANSCNVNCGHLSDTMCFGNPNTLCSTATMRLMVVDDISWIWPLWASINQQKKNLKSMWFQCGFAAREAQAKPTDAKCLVHSWPLCRSDRIWTTSHHSYQTLAIKSNFVPTTSCVQCHHDLGVTPAGPEYKASRVLAWLRHMSRPPLLCIYTAALCSEWGLAVWLWPPQMMWQAGRLTLPQVEACYFIGKLLPI